MVRRIVLLVITASLVPMSALAQQAIRVTIKSTTPNSAIYINGVERGVDSCIVRLRPDQYKIKATCEGRRAWEGEVAFADSVLNQSFRIPELELITGLFSVDYQPKGADVYFDGEYMGKSPLVGSQAKRVPVGRHSVRIAHEGYEPFERIVQIDEEGTQPLAGDLTMLYGLPAVQTKTSTADVSKREKPQNVKKQSNKLQKEQLKAEKKAKKREKAEAKKKKAVEKAHLKAEKKRMAAMRKMKKSGSRGQTP